MKRRPAHTPSLTFCQTRSGIDPVASPRIAKSEQVSKNRFHNELKLTSPDEIDAELLSWLKDAYALG